MGVGIVNPLRSLQGEQMQTIQYARTVAHVFVECLGTVMSEKPRRDSTHIRGFAGVGVNSFQSVDILSVRVRGTYKLGEGADDGVNNRLDG